MTETTIIVDVRREWWMTSNQRIHHHDRARRTKAIREYTRLKNRDTAPVTTPATITATISTPTNRRFDPPNAWPTIKAAIDGLVDAGIIPDDNHEHIPATTFTRGPKTGTKVYQLTLTLTPIV